MKEEIYTIGVVIADSDEYTHIPKQLGNDAKSKNIFGLTAHTALLECKSGKVRVITICSGIGKVNAAVATVLIANECDIIINTGLSGGFKGVNKYDLVIGTKFVEHDFDLTAIGYKLGQKPMQDGIIMSDETLNCDIVKKYPTVKTGVFVTGDSFISSGEKHDILEEVFDPIACDMESAAVAAVANRFGKRFVSIRMISDGADDIAATSYVDTLNGDRSNGWCRLTFDWIKSL